jgi:excisionase family DNA binding protein
VRVERLVGGLADRKCMTTDVNDRRLLNVGEVANRLGVSRLTVWRLIDRGELPALRVGRQLRLDPDELDAWLYAPTRERR